MQDIGIPIKLPISGLGIFPQTWLTEHENTKLLLTCMHSDENIFQLNSEVMTQTALVCLEQTHSVDTKLWITIAIISKAFDCFHGNTRCVLVAIVINVH